MNGVITHITDYLSYMRNSGVQNCQMSGIRDKLCFVYRPTKMSNIHDLVNNRLSLYGVLLYVVKYSGSPFTGRPEDTNPRITDKWNSIIRNIGSPYTGSPYNEQSVWYTRALPRVPDILSGMYMGIWCTGIRCTRHFCPVNVDFVRFTSDPV